MQKDFPTKKLILAVSLVFGLSAWIFKGTPWGIFTSNFIYLLGITQGVLAIVVFLWLMGVKWAPDYLVPAGRVALAYAPMAFLAVLSFVAGQGEIFHWSREPGHSVWLTAPFFFARNLGGLLLFYVIVLRTLSCYRKDQSKRPKLLCALMVLFVLNQTITAWDFGMNLSPAGHSTIFAPYFWFGDLYAGLATLMLMVLLSGDKIMQLPTWKNMRKLLMAFSIIWAYLWFSQFMTTWYANIPEETGPLYARFSGDFAFPSVLMFLCLFIVPFGAMLIDIQKRVSLKPILIIILLGNWIDRYLTVVPPVRHLNQALGSLPGNSWISAVGTLAFFACFLMILSRFYRGAEKKMVG